MPVILALVIGAVAGPAVGALERRRVPRAAGAALVLLALIAVALLVVFLVVHGISANSSRRLGNATKALDKIDSSLKDAGVDTQDAKEDVEKAVPKIRSTLIHGVAAGIGGLTSLVFFLSFAALATFFILKDAPVMTRFTNRHMGLPVATASIVTREIATACATTSPASRSSPPSTGSSSVSAPACSACRCPHHRRGDLCHRVHPLHRRMGGGHLRVRARARVGGRRPAR